MDEEDAVLLLQLVCETADQLVAGLVEDRGGEFLLVGIDDAQLRVRSREGDDGGQNGAWRSLRNESVSVDFAPVCDGDEVATRSIQSRLGLGYDTNERR